MTTGAKLGLLAGLAAVAAGAAANIYLGVYAAALLAIGLLAARSRRTFRR